MIFAHYSVQVGWKQRCHQGLHFPGMTFGCERGNGVLKQFIASTFHLMWLVKTFSYEWVFVILPLLWEQWKLNGGKTRHRCTYTRLACSTQRKSNQRWYIGKCQTRINGLITLLSILPVLSVSFFSPSAFRLSSLFFTALIGSVKGARAVKNQSHRQKTLGRI